MLESTQQTNEIDLNHQWFRVACYWLLTKKKKTEKKDLKHFCKQLRGILGNFP